MLAIDDIKNSGSGIFDSILQFLIRTFTSQAAKEAAKHVRKTALEAGKTVAVDAAKKLIDKAMQPKKKKVEDIMSKYTADQKKRQCCRHSRLSEKTKQVGIRAERDIKNNKKI